VFERNVCTVVGFEVITAVVVNVAIFWDIAQCSPYVNRRFGSRSVHILDTRHSAHLRTCTEYDNLFVAVVLYLQPSERDHPYCIAHRTYHAVASGNDIRTGIFLPPCWVSFVAHS
jgi:hypothetical protein